ncbi:hypothetical protein [Streptomyces sp. NPDC056358]|uniref:hypothetical protein n=1 Tax=Streptomyces sp. NPDC056358 TaxID=3345794 RepID=UPI0035D74BB4
MPDRTDRWAYRSLIKFGTDFTDQHVIQPFNEAKADKKVRLAAVANNKDNFSKVFGKVLADRMADHIHTIAGMGR